MSGAAMLERIQQEPVYTMAVVQAAIALAVSFGLELSAEQVGMIVAFTAAVLSWITRSNVTPLGKADV